MAFAAWLIALVVPVAAPAARADEPRTLRAGTDAEVAKAVADARPGDTILVADGTYADTLAVRVSGRAGRPITLKAEHPRKAVFTRVGPAALVEGSFLGFEGLVFDGRYGDCTCVRVRGRNVHFLGCEIRRAGSADGKGGGDGLQFYDSSTCLVEKCHIHHCLASRGGERVDSHGVRFTRSRDMTVRGVPHRPRVRRLCADRPEPPGVGQRLDRGMQPLRWHGGPGRP
jgi:hypothetical protein